MKVSWLMIVTCYAQLAFAQVIPDEATVELMLAKEQYSRSIQAAQSQADYASAAKWQHIHAQALIGQRQHEAARELLATALQRFPQDAELYYLDALNTFALAEQASLFSVASEIKAGLAQLQQAVQLAPQRLDWQLKLMGFYLEAPSLLGGDPPRAKQIAQQLATDQVAAAIAQSMLLSHEDKFAQALAVLDAQLAITPMSAQLLLQKASLLRKQQQEAQALPYYQQAAAHAETMAAKYQQLYQVGRIAARNEQDHALAKQVLTEVIAFYQEGEGETLHWAQLRLAQVYVAEKNVNAAEVLLQPLYALKKPASKLATELKTLRKQLGKLRKKEQRS